MATVRRLLVLLIIVVSSTNVPAQASTATRGRRSSNAPAAEATVSVNEQFLNAFLTAIFDNLQEPSMPLTIGGATPSASRWTNWARSIRKSG